jgi:hypothetical protein
MSLTLDHQPITLDQSSHNFIGGAATFFGALMLMAALIAALWVVALTQSQGEDFLASDL